MIRSKFEDFQICDAGNDNDKSGFLYGMFEIRCKLPKKNGQYPAFWLTGNNSWPPEIDVFEFNGSNRNSFFSTVHWPHSNFPNPKNESASNFYNFPFDLSDDFHTYTVVWTPTKITWFFDGRELKSDNLVTHLPGTSSPNNYERCKWNKMNLIISAGLNFPDSWESNFDPLIVDFVRVYKPSNLPLYNSSYNFDNYFDNTLFPIYSNTNFKSSQDWILKKVVSANSYNSYSDLSVVQNGGKFYYKGDYNLLWTTYWYDYGQGGQFYASPIDWGYSIDGNISTAYTENSVEIPFFKKGTRIQYHQNGTFYSIKDPSTGRTNFATINTNNPKIIANNNGIELIYLGDDNNIWYAYRPDIYTHDWIFTSLGNTGTATHEIVTDPTNFYQIYYKNTSNQLISMINYGGWAYESVISSINDIASNVSISPSGTKLYHKNTSNQLIYHSLNSGIWQRVAFNAIYPWSNGQNIQVDNVLSDIQVSSYPDQIYFIGTDNRVWVLYEESGIWKATAINWMVNYAITNLKISSPTTNQKRLSFIGSDHQIRYFYYDFCENLNPPINSITPHSFKLKKEEKSITIDIDQSDPNKLLVMPNPAYDKVYLTTNLTGKTANVIIYDFLGRILVNRKRLIGNRIFSEDISTLSPGTYIIQVISGNTVLKQKFLKVKR